jgi:hypothetical protein
MRGQAGKTLDWDVIPLNRDDAGTLRKPDPICCVTEVILVLSLFALTYSILMLYAGCSRIGGISEAGAAPAVPIILLLSAWITKIIVTALW